MMDKDYQAVVLVAGAIALAATITAIRTLVFICL
jgi:hypothetical protein